MTNGQHENGCRTPVFAKIAKDRAMRKNDSDPTANEFTALRAQLAEAQEQNRILTARCDELVGELTVARKVLREVAGERDAMRPVVEAVAADGVFLPACKWSVTCDRVKFPVSAVRPEPCSSCRTRAAVDAYRANPARCSDEDYRAPLREGERANHAVGCRAEHTNDCVATNGEACGVACDEQDEVNHG